METEFFSGEDHSFSEGFTAALPGMLGMEKLENEDGTPIKMFETTPNLGSLVKSFYDTKSAMGGMVKAENVIRKPGENPSDDEVSAYMAEIHAAAGVPTEAQNYEFALGEGETEETLYNEEAITAYKDFAKENNVPADVFAGFVAINRKLAGAETTRINEAILTKETESIDKIKKEHPGEKLAITGKNVFATLSKFNKNNPEFLAKMKEADVFNNPTDFQRWKNAGVTPQNFIAWASISQEMKISHSSDGEGGGAGGSDLASLLPASAASLGVK